MTKRKLINRLDVDAVGKPVLGHPQAVIAHPYVFLSGQMATDFGTGIVPESGRTKPETPYWVQRMKGQAERIIESTRAVLNEAGTDLANVAKVVTFHTDLRELPISMETRTQYFPSSTPPASTALGIAQLPVEDAGWLFETIGFIPGDGLKRRSVFLDDAPVLSVDGKVDRPVFANAVVAGDLVFTQGSIARGTGGGIHEGASVRHAFALYESAIKNQTVFVLNKLGQILEAAGSSLKDVVKADCWLVSPHDYPGMDEAFREVFPDDPPARTVAVVRELVVRGALIEISLVAVRRGGAMRKTIIAAPDAPPPLGHESPAVRAGNLLFTSTLVARNRWDPASSGRPQLAVAGAEAEEAIAAAKSVLEVAGGDLRSLARLRAFHSDLAGLRAGYEAWHSAVGDHMPAFTAVGAGPSTVLPHASVAYDLIAVVEP
jgi:enamine deaminase RidA (YjgF/YER057c/UK114 family)